MVSKSVKLKLSVFLGFIVLSAGILYWIYIGSESRKNAEFIQTMEAFYDEPWHVLRMSNRLTDDGNNMMYCEKALQSPAKTMSILDSKEIFYKVEDHIDEFADRVTIAQIEIGEGDEGQTANYFRGMQFCMFWAEAQGYEIFNPESYQ